MAQELGKRETVYESFDAADPNRKMALEETPWLVEARGGTDAGYGIEKVLDPRVAAALREASLAKLLKAQTSLGAFPWWPGGPPSPYMTLYIVHGFSKALEFGVAVPKEPVARAFGYLHRHYLDEIVADLMAHDTGWEFVELPQLHAEQFPGRDAGRAASSRRRSGGRCSTSRSSTGRSTRRTSRATWR